MTTSVPWRNRIVRTGLAPLDDVAFNPKNWRIHPKAQQDALAGVLGEVGVVQHVIINERTGNLIDGHLRVTLADRNGESAVPAVWVDLSESEEALVLATLDPLAAMAGTDAEQLAALLAEVSTDDAALRAMLDALAEDAGIASQPVPAQDPGAQLDRAEELRAKWGTARGQLWVIGHHRLLCGDATCAEDVARLMGGETAELSLTDPPYNVGIDYGAGTDDRNVDYPGFSERWFRLCQSSGVVFTPGTVNLAMWCRFERPKWICAWRKVNQQSPSGLNGYNAWEPLLVYGQHAKPVAHDCWDIPVSQSEDLAHPVPKTTEAWRTFLAAFSTERAVVYDPFLGSGTTMVVAEQLGRVCYGLEIEPKYIAVALERLAGMGLAPRLVS